MDKAIRDRLLAMPGEYRTLVTSLLMSQGELVFAKTQSEVRRVGLLADANADGKVNGTNETARKLQIDGILNADSVLAEWAEKITTTEYGIKANQMGVEALKFESAILIAIVTAEGNECCR